MKVSSLTRALLLLALTALLAACGGGGSDGGSFDPPSAQLSVTPSSITMNTDSAVSVTVNALQASGIPVANGTSVNVTVSPASAGSVSAVGSGVTGTSATATTSGGAAVFLFQSSGQPGTATLNVSMADPSAPGNNVTRTINVSIGTGPSNDPRLTCDPTKTEIPVNPQGVPFFIGSPYIAEVIWNVRSASGQPIQDDGDGDQAVQFTVSPLERGAVSVPDDPATEENEASNPFSSVFSGVASGLARSFVWSFNEPGPLTVTASFTDPDTGQRVVAECVFNIVSSAPALPAAITFSGPAQPIYIRDSGGNQSSIFSVLVNDGNGAGVPDPVSGNQRWNNVRVEIVDGPVPMDATLSGTNAQGSLVTGRLIDLATTDGIATPTLRAGDTPGTYTIRATADAADNNVDNGITDPVVGTFTIVVGDGRLFSVELAVPGNDALFVNQVIVGDVLTENPDGTYSVTVSAIATDRQGNPVVPGTVINFGLIDEPQNDFPLGIGGFDISGNDGNPQEAGTLFTAPSGQFLTAGGGAGPGDTLVLFGEDVPGNHDHESARTVASVDSQTRLTVTRRFNRNDHTGSIVDSGPVIPYIVGRAEDATIPATAVTNELGVATTRYTFPVSQLGKPVVIWAQGEGELVNNIADTVGDVEIFAFFGAGPAELSVSPDPIPGNRAVPVLACVFDANLNPMQGLPVSFQFTGLAGGSGSIDGVSDSGIMPERTGPDGCASGILVTSNVPAGTTGGAQVVFSAAGEVQAIDIVVNVALLTATPTFVRVPVSGTEAFIQLELLDDQGEGVPGVVIEASCTAGLEVLAAPGATGVSGTTAARIRACGFTEGQAGSCTFTAATGQSAQTLFEGGGAPASPPYAGCGT